MFDRRVGKRTIRLKLHEGEKHPFVRRMLEIRSSAEGLARVT